MSNIIYGLSGTVTALGVGGGFSYLLNYIFFRKNDCAWRKIDKVDIDILKIHLKEAEAVISMLTHIILSIGTDKESIREKFARVYAGGDQIVRELQKEKLKCYKIIFKKKEEIILFEEMRKIEEDIRKNRI